jgi:hypothetical protein
MLEQLYRPLIVTENLNPSTLVSDVSCQLPEPEGLLHGRRRPHVLDLNDRGRHRGLQPARPTCRILCSIALLIPLDSFVKTWDLYYNLFKHINKQLPSLTTLGAARVPQLSSGPQPRWTCHNVCKL